MLKTIKKVNNPLTVIAIFAGLAEISGTAVLPLLKDTNQFIFLWFVIFFQVLLVVLFFATLNRNHRVLYAPTDYRDDNSFLKTIRPLTETERTMKLNEDISGSKPAPAQDDTEPPNPLPTRPQPPTNLRIVDDSLAQQYGIAQQRVLCDLQSDFVDTYVVMNAGVDQEPTMNFDAMGFNPKKQLYTAVEVKLLRSVDFPSAYIRTVMDMGDRFVEVMMNRGFAAKLILAIVTDVDPDAHAQIQRRIFDLAKQCKYLPDLKLFQLSDLIRKDPVMTGTMVRAKE